MIEIIPPDGWIDNPLTTWLVGAGFLLYYVVGCFWGV